MASYLRPRRGKKATALSQNITLKAGEVFFETPTTGVGTGAGRIMMGNGSNNYTYLNNNKKAFITDINCPDCYISNFTATAGNTTLTNNDTYLNNMKPGASASTFFSNRWTLLSSHNKQLTQLNSDLTTETSSCSNGEAYSTVCNATWQNVINKNKKVINLKLTFRLSTVLPSGTQYGIFSIPSGYQPTENIDITVCGHLKTVYRISIENYSLKISATGSNGAAQEIVYLNMTYVQK